LSKTCRKAGFENPIVDPPYRRTVSCVHPVIIFSLFQGENKATELLNAFPFFCAFLIFELSVSTELHIHTANSAIMQ